MTGTSFRTGATIALLAAAAGCQPKAAAIDAAEATPIASIAGGNFEASGVAWVPGTNTVLFVDDGRNGEIFAVEIDPNGKQVGGAATMPLGTSVTDMEGMTTDGEYFYVVGSQSKRTGHEGDGLVRFRFDPTGRRIDGLDRIAGLKVWLARNVPELRGTENRLGDKVLNIEAIAWDPGSRRLLLGLRAPVIDGHALVIPLRLADTTGAFTRDNLRADSTLRVDLGGAGIRALEYDAEAKAFRVVTGATLDRENRDFRMLEWDGKSLGALRDIASWPSSLKPEGVTRALLGGRPASVLVFDTGRLLVLDASP